jgi:hypothetical protein
MKIKFIVLNIIALFVSSGLSAQIIDTTYFNNISLQIDTLCYSLPKDTAHFQGKDYLFFQYSRENEICDVKIYPSVKQNIKKISLVESADFDLLDSVINYNNKYYTFKVRFKNLSESAFLRFRLNIFIGNDMATQDIPLLPVTKTTVQLNTKSDELAVGEEKVFELVTNHPENIKPIPDWQSSQDVDYRLVQNNGQLFIHLLANSAGNKVNSISLQTYKPSWVNGFLTCDIPPILKTFQIKSGALIYLQTDKNDFILDEKSKNDGIEIQLDNHKYLQLNNVYLVEAKETPGSRLIAEIITKERLSNNKILCLLKLFNYHRKSEGYLYIKDNNVARFISNFNIIPNVSIEHIKIMRNGKDWVEDATIYPDETFNLRLEGQSLDKAHFRFGELTNLSADTALKDENSVEFKLKVPSNISKKTIEIFNNNQNTGKYLTIKEYQKPHIFNYITINYGDKHKILSEINGPELYDKTIKDVVISFQPNKIDTINKLFGKQYLNIDVKILGKKDEIIDMATIENVAICPDEKSPRYSFYDKTDCKNSEISLNSKISNTTYSLNDWSKIRLSFKNPADKYTQDAQNKAIEIILQKHYNFDIDVSFPAGLLIKKTNTPGYGNFGGVSMAVLGQYSFYKKDKINQLQPYKIGAGFLALNAFDFSGDQASRDIGAVVLGTLNPINTDRKLVFSLYLGGGYLLSGKTFFWLVGPGISVQI